MTPIPASQLADLVAYFCGVSVMPAVASSWPRKKRAQTERWADGQVVLLIEGRCKRVGQRRRLPPVVCSFVDIKTAYESIDRIEKKGPYSADSLKARAYR